MSWIDLGLSFVIERWKMRLSLSPMNVGLANLLFLQLPLQSPRWVLRKPLWLILPVLAPGHCLVFVRDDDISLVLYRYMC